MSVINVHGILPDHRKCLSFIGLAWSRETVQDKSFSDLKKRTLIHEKSSLNGNLFQKLPMNSDGTRVDFFFFFFFLQCKQRERRIFLNQNLNEDAYKLETNS